MRLSVGTAGAVHVCVILDGFPVRNCIFADEDGFVEVLARPEVDKDERVVLRVAGDVRLYWLGTTDERARFRLDQLPMATAEMTYRLRNGPWHPGVEAQCT